MTTQERIDTNARAAMAAILDNMLKNKTQIDAPPASISKAAYSIAEAMEAERGRRIASRVPDVS